MTYTIGALAAAAGVPASTVRFYERSGLFKPDFRTVGNYRAYREAALQRLRFIRAAQASGFALEDVREMLGLTDSETPPCKEVIGLLEHRLAEVRQRLGELRRVEKALSASLKTCCRGGPDWCGEIQRLGGKQPGRCRPGNENSRVSKKISRPS